MPFPAPAEPIVMPELREQMIINVIVISDGIHDDSDIYK